MAPESIYYNGKIVTVDPHFSIVEAVAIGGGRFLATGSDREILALASGKTHPVNLKGSTAIPGLIDSHAHPKSAALTELNTKTPAIRSLDELFSWIKSETLKREEGAWIIHPKFFVTRLRERRYPTQKELDRVTPENPVFLNGTYGGLVNRRALQVSGLGEDISNPAVFKDPITGVPTGFIRREAFDLLKLPEAGSLDDQAIQKAVVDIFQGYNTVGITGVTDGEVVPAEIPMYRVLERGGKLSLRVNLGIVPETRDTVEHILEQIEELDICTGSGDELVRIGRFKVFLDGGILTGTARMRKPWGRRYREVFGFDGENYYGELNYSPEQLIAIASAAAEAGWKFTAHCTGGGALDILLEAYEAIDKKKNIRDLRWSVIHGNFFTAAAIEKCRRLGIIVECQPAWYYKDAASIEYILGRELMKGFLPFNTLQRKGVVLCGGSDHMTGSDSYSSINPYNPFLSMYALVSRKTEEGKILYPAEVLSRPEALRMYTINNAFCTFEEDLKGSIEAGKLADMAVLSDDLLHCPLEGIRDMRVELTLLAGKVVYSTGSIV